MPGQRADQQVRRGLSRASATTAAASTSTSSSSSPSTARRRCSAPSTPTSSRTPARRPTRPSTTRCCSRATRSWASSLPHGGHLSHGMKINVSGRLYDIAPYEVTPEDTGSTWTRSSGSPTSAGRSCCSPAGSAYPRFLDFERFRAIADAVGALPDGRHGALRRARRRRPAPEPGALRRRRHDHDPQDARRRPRRHDHLHARSTPRRSTRPSSPASRAARSSTSIAGKAVALKIAAVGRSSRSARSARWRAPRPSPRSCCGPATASTCSPAAPTCTSCSSTCASPSSTASRPRTGCTTSASPSTATRCRSTRARRRSPPACAWARPRSRRAGSAATSSREIGRIIAQALQPGFESVRGELAERVTAIADAHPLYAQLGTPTAV